MAQLQIETAAGRCSGKLYSNLLCLVQNFCACDYPTVINVAGYTMFTSCSILDSPIYWWNGSISLIFISCWSKSKPIATGKHSNVFQEQRPRPNENSKNARILHWGAIKLIISTSNIEFHDCSQFLLCDRLWCQLDDMSHKINHTAIKNGLCLLQIFVLLSCVTKTRLWKKWTTTVQYKSCGGCVLINSKVFRHLADNCLCASMLNSFQNETRKKDMFGSVWNIFSNRFLHFVTLFLGTASGCIFDVHILFAKTNDVFTITVISWTDKNYPNISISLSRCVWVTTQMRNLAAGAKRSGNLNEIKWICKVMHAIYSIPLVMVC